MSTIATRLAAVRERVARAAERAQRDPASIGLVAVSKRKPASDVVAAQEAGVTCFGENYVQELVDKAATVGEGPEWHFVGHLQRNKINTLLAVPSLTLLHGVDSLRLAEALDRRLDRSLAVLVHVDVADQDSKSGVRPEALPELVSAIRDSDHLVLRGLMTMPPPTDDAEGARPFFRRLRELAAEHGCDELSMGMTHDFEVAIEEGATLIRVGTAIFGPRD